MAHGPDAVFFVAAPFLMNTLFGYGGVPAPAEKTSWFQWVERHEEAGTLRGVLGELGSTVLSFLKRNHL